MPDREKVVTGLELCTSISPDGCLILCPYKDEKDETYSGFCEQVLKRDALDLLKEQKAVEPFHKCIGNEFSLIEDSYFDYCPYCGKPITWAKQEGR